MDERRKQRKKEHIKYSMLLEKMLKRNVFSDITILHNCLSQINLNDVDLSSNLNNIKLTSPIIINAMTGGIKKGEIINQKLSEIAKKLGLAMAVGSQTIALKRPNSIRSFKIARETNPDGIIFANLGADATVEEAVKAVKMIDADALQIHLNVPQEVMMKEGRRNFAGVINNISEIIRNIDVPVIVKEVGFGIASEEALTLVENGVKIIDVGGTGGTNFMAIENMRSKSQAYEHLQNWGIPTPISLIETVKAVGHRADIIASGGLKNGLDAAKSLALGAKATAFAGSFLYILLKEGPSSLEKHILRIEKEIRFIMAMAGVRNIEELKQRPVIIQGKSFQWLKCRGISI